MTDKTPAMPELPDGATVLPDGSAFAIAKAARNIAMKLHLGQFSCPAYMERELIRRFTAAHQATKEPSK